MSRYHLHQAFLLAFFIGVFPAGAHAGGRAISTHNGTVDFGAQLLHLSDGCLSVDGELTSGTFFDDLTRRDIKGKLEYRKHGKVVIDYPKSLTASIRVLGDSCAGTLPVSPSAIFSAKSFSLKLEAQWKDGMKLRPVSYPLAAQCVGSSTLVISDGDRNSTVPSVDCQVTIESEGVPLSDHLIVSLFAADGTRLTRLSAGP